VNEHPSGGVELQRGFDNSALRWSVEPSQKPPGSFGDVADSRGSSGR
jgi:hypothetical protein